MSAPFFKGAPVRWFAYLKIQNREIINQTIYRDIAIILIDVAGLYMACRNEMGINEPTT
jgi:hypothetical protein